VWPGAAPAPVKNLGHIFPVQRDMAPMFDRLFADRLSWQAKITGLRVGAQGIEVLLAQSVRLQTPRWQGHRVQEVDTRSVKSGLMAREIDSSERLHRPYTSGSLPLSLLAVSRMPIPSTPDRGIRTQKLPRDAWRRYSE
jgi:hypothetical protein